MDEELAFIKAIQSNSEDFTAKLVYADWLDERGRHEKAEWLRLFVDPGKRNYGSVEAQRFTDLQYGILPRSWIDLILGATQIWDHVTSVTLAHLEATLNTYASLNDHRSDISYSFTTGLIRKHEAIEVLASRLVETKFHPVILTPMTDWLAETRSLLDRWLFAEIRDARIVHPHHRLAIALPEGRTQHTDRVLKLIQGAIAPVAGWNMNVTANGYYWIDGNEILLEGNDRVLYLGFQLDD